MGDFMKKVGIVSFLIICLFSAMLTGCSKEETEAAAEAEAETEERNMFGLTEDEQKMYVEYAAGVLMKYNAGSNMRVLEGQTLVNQEAKEQAAKEQEEKRAQLAAEYEANKNSNKNESQNSGDSSSSGSSISYINDMSEATGTNSFSITYEGYEVTDSYPSSGDDVFMAMDATQGKLLLVTKFSVKNISGQTENFDMFSKQAKFRLKVNGERYRSQYTLLLDDLSVYKGDIDAGAAVQTVLIFEIPETAASNISDMVLSITVNDEISYMQLSGGSEVIDNNVNVEKNIDSESENEVFETPIVDIEQENTNKENDKREEQSNEPEYNDLAEEYMNAIEAGGTGTTYIEKDSNKTSGTGTTYYNNNSEESGGNVTVVGSDSFL